MTKISLSRKFMNGSTLRPILLLFTSIALFSTAHGQQQLVRSLKNTLYSGKVTDSAQYTDLLNRISALSLVQQLDTTYVYAAEAKALAARIHYHKGLADAYMNLAASFSFQNNSKLAHRFYLEGLHRYRNLGDSAGICQALYCIGSYYHYEGKDELAIPYMEESMGVGGRLLKDSVWASMLANYYLVFAEDSLRQDSARWALGKARDIATRYHDDRIITYTGLFLAHEEVKAGRLEKAMENLRRLAAHSLKEGYNYLALYANAQMDIYATYAQTPDSIIYRKQMLDAAILGGYKKLMVRPVTSLYQYYKAIGPAEAIPYADVLREIALHQEGLRTQGEQDYMESFLQEQEVRALRLNKELQEQTLVSDKLKGRHRMMLIVFAVICTLLAVGLVYVYSRSTRESHMAAKRMKEINRMMMDKNKQLQRHDDFKNKLLSILAHDFRLPLAHIISVTNLFQQKDIKPEQFQEIANSISSMASETLQLFETVLSWIKTQLAGFEYKAHPYLLQELWNDAKDPLMADIIDKALLLDIKIPYGLTVRVDREMLQFVNRNLLHNAVKYSRRGSPVTIEARRKSDRIIVTVTNGGSGITEMDMPYIFTHRVPGAITRETGRGAGLALIICKDFIEKMNGTITVSSDGETYTTFEYTLPAFEEDEMA
ncbi:sensor histidine kinase [Chitinophaga sp. GCM10012297]|uniref:histidine kinase n=1 Tax=Chitinophaga chungangae TaxID=2821488 RepID=A0ABS3YDL2_9BACT|nr:HAMP domain-containing sensor histidine kinase [Chitinophaga chungangae]MBO9152746.1 HAMP domain-containing histidine kinase [Chitinophaga chungangae]